MKIFVKAILRNIISSIFALYNCKMMNTLKSKKSIVYSFWIRNYFRTCGSDIYIQSPSYVKGGQYISIGEGFSSCERLRLECWDMYGDSKFTPVLTIGDNVCINYNVHIGCINKIVIGNNVLLGSNILITDHQHGFIDRRDLGISPAKRSLSSNGPVIIEDDVWIGENVSIMPNVTIGKGCIIGANSVVTRSFPENSVLAGIPAKLLKKLNKEA